MRVAEAFAELWGALCPDIGPEEWANLVRWAARHVNAPARMAVLELESGLQAHLAHQVLEWYHGDDELMPQVLVDQLTAEAARLLGPGEKTP